MTDVIFEDLVRAIEGQAPDFADRVVALLDQPDPPEDRPENADDEKKWPPLPDDVWTLDRVKAATAPGRLAEKSPTERKNVRREAYQGLLAAPYPPPRAKLGPLLAELYDREDDWARAQLVEIFKRGKLGFGVWQAFKTVYKRAEARHDAAMFGVLAFRLDAFSRTPHTAEIGRGTIVYLRRRAWRYLRQLGRAVPEMYPHFAAQVLKHYPLRFRFDSTWIAAQIWAHEDLVGHFQAAVRGPPSDLDRRAFNDAWKLSPDPLLRLLEDAVNDQVCDFAIRSLKRDFPARLKTVDAAWLKRIGKKPSASAHAFLIEALTASPEFHQSRLRSLGLHRTVLDLLRSESVQAREYAIRYARTHAPDLEVAELIELAKRGARTVKEFAIERLGDRDGADIGLGGLVALVAVEAATTMAASKLRQTFKPTDLSTEDYIRLATGTGLQRRFVRSWFEDEQVAPPVGALLALVEHPDGDYRARRQAFDELDARSGREIGGEWFKRALMVNGLSDRAARWLREGKLSGDDLDVDWLKGLFMRQGLRSLALELLGNRRLVAPGRIGLPWLLALVRQPDESAQTFAQRYLLEHFTPEEFGGLDRIWGLASGAKEPDAVRRFAATYLRVHHPQLGPTTAEAAQLGVRPGLPLDAYALDRVRPLFFDERADVRQLAVAVGRREMVRWGDRGLLYDLAASRFREPRVLAAEMLLNVADATADPETTPPLDWLDPVRIYALTESPIRGAREIALNLIVAHYDALGGPERLAWLMESPDRDVRAFAVRLLWQRHRPQAGPTKGAPAGGDGDASAGRRFESGHRLQSFLRTVLFGLPPGRRPRHDLRLPLRVRPAPASVTKRQLIEVVRDLAVIDAEFAQIVIPVIETFAHSVGKTEWQACVTALVRIRNAHPNLSVALGSLVQNEARAP